MGPYLRPLRLPVASTCTTAGYDGEWSREQDGTMLGSGPYRGIPWTDAQRIPLGLPWRSSGGTRQRG